jgi:HK97 family phage prohead protease
LTLADEKDGLYFDIAVPDTTAGRDAIALAERGDLGGASIGFIVEEEAREKDVRIIKRARLLEISVVSAWPAYAETSVEARRRAISAVPKTPRRDRLGRFLQTV